MKTNWKVKLSNWIGATRFGLRVLGGKSGKLEFSPDKFPLNVKNFLGLRRRKGNWVCEVNAISEVVHGKVTGTGPIYTVAFSVEPEKPKPPKSVTRLAAFASGDGAHCGLTDWYPKQEEALLRALKSGKPFDTGWYSSKKEIASARIYTDYRQPCPGIFVEVSVSDDFDTIGRSGSMVIERTLDGISKAISEALEDAEVDRKNNQTYRGYSIHHKGNCIDYFLVNCAGMDQPPGDFYQHWGWQDSEDEGATPSFKIPKRTADAFSEHAWSLSKKELKIGQWTIKPWN